MEIIPALDIIDGKCVRLAQGNYDTKIVYDENPLEVAMRFESAGVRRLHLVDLDGAKKGVVVNLNVLERIASTTDLVIDFGGGIKTDSDISDVFSAGASIATVGSIAVKNKELFFQWMNKYGGDKILLGADVRGEKIAVAAWLETTELSVFDFLKEFGARGMKQVFCTDIASDGLLNGPAEELYRKILEMDPSLSLIASGGVSTLSDLERLDAIGCSGVIVGKAIYEGRILLGELKKYLR